MTEAIVKEVEIENKFYQKQNKTKKQLSVVTCCQCHVLIGTSAFK